MALICDNAAPFLIDSSHYVQKLHFLLKNIPKSLVIFSLSYNALPYCGNVIASYSYRVVSLLLWPHVYSLSLCTVIAIGKLVVLPLL
jgi:hypothetical protein